MASTKLRYVPQGLEISLSSDAPGWSAEANINDKEDEKGPTCWKCKGTCVRPIQKKFKVSSSNTKPQQQHTNETSTNDTQQHQQQHNSNSNQVRECPVCNGKGYLPIKSKLIQSQNQIGVITSRRNRPLGWMEFGHMPSAVQATKASSKQQEVDEEDDIMGYAIQLLAKANGIDDDYTTKRNDVPIDMSLIEKYNNDNKHSIPSWLPINPGEQLCNLVGRWRILQRVASHRWTTDDLVTAYVAASTFVSSQTSVSSANKEEEGEETSTLRYLDLGTGNASVLQMSTWYLLSTLHSSNSKYKKIETVGVEARSEAVGLARRSLSFNLGSIEYQGKAYTGGCADESEELKHDVQIVQGDFRNLVSLSSSKAEDTASSSSATPHVKSIEDVASKRYDLITGTPPYFRVGFTKSSNNAFNDTSDNNETITSAVIEEGGMPTSKQSAPARCEFRGGIEAYCLTASAMLSPPNGRFVVCENWLNNHRVWSGAKEAGLIIESVQPVRGGVRKEHNLFAVYVMKKKEKGDDGEQQNERDVVLPALVVRDEHGKWTKEYARVMQSMSIPVV